MSTRASWRTPSPAWDRTSKSTRKRGPVQLSSPLGCPVVLILDMRYADPNYVGFIPTFLDLDDPRPAAVQFQERYEYGGWRPQEGFTAIDGTPVLEYPGDPPLKPIAVMQLRKETIFVYLHGYVSIFQEDGSFVKPAEWIKQLHNGEKRKAKMRKLVLAIVAGLTLTSAAFAGTHCREVCRDGAWGTGYCYVDCR